MLGQTFFHFAGADAVPSRTYDVVVAPLKPDVALRVPDRHVTQQAQLPQELLRRGFRIAPILKKHHGIGLAHGDDTLVAGGQHIALSVDDLHDMTGHRAPHRARPHREQARRVADHQIDLGLAEELGKVEIEGVPAPGDHGLPSRSPPVPTERSRKAWRARGSGTCCIRRKAVGGMKVLCTSWRARKAKAHSGSNLARWEATTGTPK